MKIRYIALGFIALDILCIPVTAKLAHNISLTSFSPHHTVSTELPRTLPGTAHIVVSSNEPFVLTASGLAGQIDVNVKNSGAINTTRFGDKARMPGPAHQCSHPSETSQTIIYTADQPTTDTDGLGAEGEILSRSVIITVRFPESADPEFSVLTDSEARKLPNAGACEAPRS